VLPQPFHVHLSAARNIAEDESSSVKSRDEEISGVVGVGPRRRRLTVTAGALMGNAVEDESRRRNNKKEGV
jgi:hypothetical protein